ncbi:MAG: sulfotransferase family 2 domain-containing protein [Pseudomonadota bacterium]
METDTAPLDAKPRSKRRDVPERLYVSRSTGLSYYSILKCGTTYMKSLLWYLDRGEEHKAGSTIHRDVENIARSDGATVEDVRQNPLAFIILRNPVDRFVSFYFEKVANPTGHDFSWFRDLMADSLDLTIPDDDLEGHRRNCDALLDWLRKNLRHETEHEVNKHWRRQTFYIRTARPLGLKVLTLNDLDRQLPILTERAIPDIATRMTAVKNRNRSKRPLSRDMLLTGHLRAKIGKIYGPDLRHWRSADEVWKTIEPGVDPDRIPRLGRDI